MKIGLVTPWYGEFAGGAEVLARNLAQNLSKNGYDVEVLTTCSRSPFYSWWDDFYKPGKSSLDNIAVQRFRLNRGNQDSYHAINHLIISGSPIHSDGEKEYFKGSISSDDLTIFVNKNQSDYIFLLIPYLYGTTYWTYLAAPKRCILIPCLHDERQAYFSIICEMLKSCILAFNSPEEMDLALKICNVDNMNSLVCGCGVDLPENYHPDIFRKKYGIDFPYILYAGRKDAGKGLIELIQYFEKYKKDVKDDLHLVFIGGGDASLIPNKDYFIDLGYVSEDDKFNAYAGALVTCLLSKNESFSFVIMESWGASTPVIVSDNCSVTRGHSIRSNGGLPIRDADEFCESICYLRNHPEVRAGLGLNGRDYVLRNYTWSLVIQRYKELFKKMEGSDL